MDFLLSVWLNLVFIANLVAWGFFLVILSFWIYPFFVLNSWMTTKKKSVDDRNLLAKKKRID